MKKIAILVLGSVISLATYAYEHIPTDSCLLVTIDLTCQIQDATKPNIGPHRIPIRAPNVYLDKDNSTIYFENPCYEYTLELVVPGIDIVEYTYIIPDGDNVVALPESLFGQYELHIHHGNICFWGLIELVERL